jgi:hypothetical protein
VIGLGGVGIEAEVELVGPAEVEAGAAERVVAELRGGVALGYANCISGKSLPPLMF